MKPTVLLTGARAPVTLDLARALKNAGHKVIGAESFKHALSKNSIAFDRFYSISSPNQSLTNFKDDLLRVIQIEKVELLIPTCEEVFHVARVREDLSCDVLVDSFQKLNHLHQKFEFNSFCKKENIDAPESFRIHTFDEAEAILKSLNWGKYVLKPDYSRFASSTRILDLDSSLQFLKASSLQKGAAWVIQKFLKGPEFCTYSLVKNGQLLAHVTYDHEFTAGPGAGICFRAIHHPVIEKWVKIFVQKYNFTGQIAFDFIQLEDGNVQALECNPRATSGLHLVAHLPLFLEALTARRRDSTISIPATPPPVITPKVGAEGQLRLAMLVYGLPSIRTFKRLAHWLNTFFFAREVVFSFNDLRPFFDQFATFFNLLLISKRLKISPLEVSTQDIEWNGEKTQ